MLYEKLNIFLLGKFLCVYYTLGQVIIYGYGDHDYPYFIVDLLIVFLNVNKSAFLKLQLLFVKWVRKWKGARSCEF